MRALACAILIFASVAGLRAQTDSSAFPRVRASLSADSVMIGDQFRLRVEIDKDMVQLIQFPIFRGGKVGDKLEIMAEGPVDTLKKDGRRLTIGREYLLTTFDEGIYALGKFPVLYVDKNIVDTIWSVDSLNIVVGTFEIDTLTQKIFDIKPPMKAPLKVDEFWGYAIIACAVIFVVAMLLLWLTTRRKEAKRKEEIEKMIAPHVAAIQELEKIYAQKMWQSGRHKQYYTSLTDVVREYIERRYDIPAMEMTSEEIFSSLESREIPASADERLVELLRMADLVKFAKLVPDADDNESAYNNAYYFVEDTKVMLLENSDNEEDLTNA